MSFDWFFFLPMDYKKKKGLDGRFISMEVGNFVSSRATCKAYEADTYLINLETLMGIS